MQQKGKSNEQCQMEYIALFAKCDAEFRTIVDQVLSGDIKNIKVEDSQMKAGGIMSKSVPRPKPEDDTPYIKSLNER